MALNYTVSYKKNATSRLFPALAIDNPQLYGNTPLRLTIDLRGVDGRLQFESRYGATLVYIDGVYKIDGTALAINDFLSTCFYKAAPVDGTDAIAVEVSLVRHIGVDAILEPVDAGVINFVSRGFAPGEFPPVQPFSPVWLTPTGTILELTEGQSANFQLSGVLSTTMVGSDVPYLGALRVVNVPQEHAVESVLVNGHPAHFSRDVDVLSINYVIPTTPYYEGRDARRTGDEGGNPYYDADQPWLFGDLTEAELDALTSEQRIQRSNKFSWDKGYEDQFHGPILDTDTVEIRLATPLNYSKTYGALPPGLEMASDGTITGTLGVLPNAKIGVTQTFAFGIRVNTGENVYRDRRFVIKATPTTNSEDDPRWIDAPPVGDVQSIGLYTRGAPISYVIQTTAPNGVPGVLVEATSDETSDENFSGLPAGVTLLPTGVITGIIDPSTKVGTHHFAALLRNSRGEDVDTRKFSLIVTSPSGPLEPLRFVRWRTPAGPVGTFYEGEVCPVGVRAYSTTGEAVTYSVLPNTPLPSGITIDPTTGDLQGVFSHVSAEVDYAFTARAAVGATFIDREFILTVQPRYNSSGAVNVSFRLRRNEAVPMIADYDPLIPTEDFFRPTDVNFGELKEPVIYVIGGLRKSDSANMAEGPDLELYPEPVEYVAAAIRNSKFGGPVKLRLGGHKVALVKLGATVIYEVLYREVLDPLDLAGGFVLNTRDEPVRDPLQYPQASNLYIYPESIKNLRYDLALQVGFDAFDTTQNTKLGVGSPENLPMWMKTPQVGNQKSSIIGFVPAMVVAYLKPGAGQRALDKLALRTIDAPHPLDDANPLAKNHEVSFDQYYLSYDSISEPTMFDGGQTTFDGDATRFDEYAYQKGKYQRMNPKGGN